MVAPVTPPVGLSETLTCTDPVAPCCFAISGVSGVTGFVVVASTCGCAQAGFGVGVGGGGGAGVAATAALPAEVATPCGMPFSLPCFTSYFASDGPLFDFDVVCTTLSFNFGAGGGFVCFTGGGVDLGGGVGGGGVGV